MTVSRLNSSSRFDPTGLFSPKSIAVVGAETEAGARIVANIVMGGFAGPVHDRIVDGVSLAVLAEPPERIGASMQRLAEANCFAAIMPGPADDLAGHVARTGVQVLGAHSFGLAVPRLHLNATGSHIAPPAGRLALISQSSAVSRAVIDWAGPNGVGFSHIVGLGSNAGIGFGQTLDWLSRDPGTGAILLDIRRIKNHRVFLSAARAAARLRPVVAIRAGLRLLDNDGVADRCFEAALRRAGVLYVERFEDLLAAAETLSRVKSSLHDSLTIVSNALGPARMAADSALRLGLQPWVEQPLVHVASAALAATALSLAAQPKVGGVLVVHAPQGVTDEATIDSLCRLVNADTRHTRAPVLVCAMGESSGAPHRARLAHAGLPVFATPDQAVRGFEYLVRDRHNRAAARELPSSAMLTVDPNRGRMRQSFADARAAGRLTLLQDEAFAILEAYGIPAIPTRFVASVEDAVAAAASLGHPALVALRKARVPADTAADDVASGLHDDGEVAAAAGLLVAKALRRGGTGELLVQRCAGHGHKVAVRVSDDATFGPILAFGAAGLAQALTDKVFDLPPLNLALAGALVQRSHVGAGLRQQFAGGPAAMQAVAETLVRVSQLIVDFPEIAVLEIPSLLVGQDGVMVGDAWLRLRPHGAAAPRLAIAPYPAELVEYWLAGNEPLTIRPIRPEDAQAHTAFFHRLSPQDVRFRFFSAMRNLSAEQTARLTQVDYDREMAFVAVRETTSEIVGIARLACDSSADFGEFALIVQADMKGRGLAAHLMQRLISWARIQALATIKGQILADNQPMLGFIRHLGFTVNRMAEDREVMEASLVL